MNLSFAFSRINITIRQVWQWQWNLPWRQRCRRLCTLSCTWKAGWFHGCGICGQTSPWFRDDNLWSSSFLGLKQNQSSVTANRTQHVDFQFRLTKAGNKRNWYITTIFLKCAFTYNVLTFIRILQYLEIFYSIFTLCYKAWRIKKEVMLVYGSVANC